MPSINLQYQTAWDSFWGSISGAKGQVLWSVDAFLAAELDLKHFESYITTNNLPLVDVGCGDAYQTKFFALHLEQFLNL